MLQLLLSPTLCGGGLKHSLEDGSDLLFTPTVLQVRTAGKRCCFLTLFWPSVERGFHKNVEFRALLLPRLQNPSGTAGRFLQKWLCSAGLRLCMQRWDEPNTTGLCLRAGSLHAGVIQVIILCFCSTSTDCNNTPGILIEPHSSEVNLNS